MNKQEKIEQEIQRTLAHLYQPETLPQNPWFYSRVRQRLDEATQVRPGNFILQALKPALLALLLAVNVGTAVWYFSDTPTDTRQELLEVLADDFQLEPSSNNLFNLK